MSRGNLIEKRSKSPWAKQADYIYSFKINDRKTRKPLILSEVHVYTKYTNIYAMEKYKRHKTKITQSTKAAYSKSKQKNKQVAQLSQRDRAAGWVSYGQKWKSGTGRQYFTDIIGVPSTTVA